MSVSLRLRWVFRATALTVGLALLAHGGPAKAGHAALVIDAGTGRVLYESNADARNYPASLTKMMTL